MNIISIDSNNIDQDHICCAIGNDKANQGRALSKKNWMKERFSDGLVFKRLDDRGKNFIEYMPIEKVWKPILGKKYMVINCLWVSGKFKGKGLSTELLNECILDAKKLGMDGVTVVSSTKVKPFLTDRKYFEYHGFEVIDSAPPYFELLVLKFNKNAKNPEFTKNAKQGTCDYKKGFAFIYSSQCPFMEEYVELMVKICNHKKIPCEVVQIKDYKEAQAKGSPFGTLGIYYNGEFKTHVLMTEKGFEKFIEEVGY
jgi:GNAT superfamily N-acetyltransferase